MPIVFNYTLHGRCREEIASTKYLGVYLSKDHDLRWTEHVRYITNKANNSLGFLERNKKKMAFHTRRRRDIEKLLSSLSLNTAHLSGTVSVTAG